MMDLSSRTRSSTTPSFLVFVATVAIVVLALEALAASSWTRRHFDLQNTSNVGDDPGLTPENVRDLDVVSTMVATGGVSATPIVYEGLLFIADWEGVINVFDIEDSSRLIALATGARGSSYLGSGLATGAIAEVTVPDGEGTKEETRFYVGVSDREWTLWCLNVDEILENKEALVDDDGTAYVCEGAAWPIAAWAGTSGGINYNGNPLYRADQEVMVGGKLETRDVMYVPSGGVDCADGRFWTMDAYTGEKLAEFDTVSAGDGIGGVIWASMAMPKDGKYVYVTTGDCVQKPQVGEYAEILGAFDPKDIGAGPVWHHHRRIVDAADADIGNGPTVIDVDGPDGCHRIVNIDKDGCFYGYEQEADIAEVGEPGYDPTRIGQQRLLWRTCLLVGGLHGGFNGHAAAAHDRYVFATSSADMGALSPSGTSAPGDNAKGFMLDGCTGELQWATAAVDDQPSEAAVASGMIFHGSSAGLQVFRAASTYELLATVNVGDDPTPGGGGPAIVDGKIYVPTRAGVKVVAVVPGSNASPPQDVPTTFNGPYPEPLFTVFSQPAPFIGDPKAE